ATALATRRPRRVGGGPLHLAAPAAAALRLGPRLRTEDVPADPALPGLPRVEPAPTRRPRAPSPRRRLRGSGAPDAGVRRADRAHPARVPRRDAKELRC